MLKVSKTGTGAMARQNLYSKRSDLSNKRARLLKLEALDGRRIRLLSEMSTINEQISRGGPRRLPPVTALRPDPNDPTKTIRPNIEHAQPDWDVPLQTT
jgi:hypothetical protein